MKRGAKDFAESVGVERVRLMRSRPFRRLVSSIADKSGVFRVNCCKPFSGPTFALSPLENIAKREEKEKRTTSRVVE